MGFDFLKTLVTISDIPPLPLISFLPPLFLRPLPHSFAFRSGLAFIDYSHFVQSLPFFVELVRLVPLQIDLFDRKPAYKYMEDNQYIFYEEVIKIHIKFGMIFASFKRSANYRIFFHISSIIMFLLIENPFSRVRFNGYDALWKKRKSFNLP